MSQNRNLHLTLLATFALGIISCSGAASARSANVTSEQGSSSSIASSEFKGYPDATPRFGKYVEDRVFDTAGELIDSATFVAIDCADTDSACQAAGGKAQFLVVAEEDAYKVKWDDALKTSANGGYVIAKLVNMDHVEIPSMNLGPYTPLYEWAGLTSANTTGIVLFSLNAGKLTIVRQARNSYGECTPRATVGHRDKSAAKHKPDHKTEEWSCKQLPLPTPPASTGKMSPLFPDDLWVSCAAGCCQTTFS
jgi:hypothetical protein